MQIFQTTFWSPIFRHSCRIRKKSFVKKIGIQTLDMAHPNRKREVTCENDLRRMLFIKYQPLQLHQLGRKRSLILHLHLKVALFCFRRQKMLPTHTYVLQEQSRGRTFFWDTAVPCGSEIAIMWYSLTQTKINFIL